MSSSGPEVGWTLLLGVLSALILWSAFKRGFFSLENQQSSWVVPLRWFHVVFAFGIYFVMAFVVVRLFAPFFQQMSFRNPAADFLMFSSWVNFLTSLVIFFFLFLYLTRLPTQIASPILRKEKAFSLSEDFRMVFFCWIFSFPLVLFLSHFLDLLVSFTFRVKELPEQMAVHFLKMTFQHPFYFSLTALTVVGLAPLIEETLFRGFLQSYIRQHLGSKQAIFLTSVCFALFHYSPDQGLGNISIIGSLFTFALFLGFLYEKRGSLAAPVILHAAFNGVSVVNLYFLRSSL